MPRILGIDIPANKRIDIALRSLYGVGPATSSKVLENAKIDPATRAHTLSEDDLATPRLSKPRRCALSKHVRTTV